MAESRSALEVLHSTDPTPIAQLHPDIDPGASRVVDGVVTITWPYSVVAKSTAFILAERDFRQRREKGQLRIEFLGAAGRALAAADIGGGDEIRLSLDGAKWEKNKSHTRLPGGILEWQLKFTSRLLLSICRAETQGADVVDIDTPEEEGRLPGPADAPEDRLTPPFEPKALEEHAAPTAVPGMSSRGAKREAFSAFGTEEYASPAFLKRSRVSYGALFEGGLDIFEEENAAESKDRRRSQFNMPSAAWRYSSRSPSPEASKPSNQENGFGGEVRENAGAQAATGTPEASSARPAMIDEGCQTQELRFNSSMEVQASGESSEAVHRRSSGDLQTPFGVLFGRGPDQHETLRSAEEEAVASPNHGLGPGAESHDDVSTTVFGAPPVAGLMTRPAAFDEGMAAPDYRISAFGINHLPATSSNIDPDLQSPAPHHMDYRAPQTEDTEWQVQPLPAGYPPIPVQVATQQSMISEANSPQAKKQPLRVGSEEEGLDGFVHNGTTSTQRATSALQRDPSRDAEELKPATRDGVDRKYQDGGDIPGEDYDLRNYDRARDDDGEAESDGESQPERTDVDQQAIDLTEEDEDDRQQEQQHMAEYDTESTSSVDDSPGTEENVGYARSHDKGSMDVKAEDYDGMEEDYREGEYAEDEEYYEENAERFEGGEEEENHCRGHDGLGPTPRMSAAQDPIFISLLSDSEDEDEAPLGKPASGTEYPQPRDPSRLVRTDDDVASEDASQPEGSGLEEAQQAGADGPDEDAEGGAEAPVSKSIDDSKPLDLMDVDKAPNGERQTTPSVEKDVQSHMSRTGALTQDGFMDNPSNTALERGDANVGDFASQSPGPQEAKEAKQQPAEASDAWTHDDLPNGSSQDPPLEQQAPGAAMPSAMAEAQEAQKAHVAWPIPDGQSEGSKVNSRAQSVEKMDSEGIEQLATPWGARGDDGAPATIQDEERSIPEGENDLTAEAQTMTEHPRHGLPVEQAVTDGGDVNLGCEATQPGPVEARVEDETKSNDQQLQVLITVKSSRSRTLETSRWGDGPSGSHEDPSILLARTPAAEPPNCGQEMETESAMTVRATRNKGDQPDPSILLARASGSDIGGHARSDDVPSTSRVTRSMVDKADGSRQLPKTLSSSAKSTRRHATPEVTRELRSKQQGKGWRGSPERGVESVLLKSPSVAGSVAEDEDVAAVKRQLLKTLRTKLADVLPLRSLRTSLNRTVDILAVSTWTPRQAHRPKHGPRDHMLEIILTDPSTAPCSVSVAHIFRPHQASLPVVHAGDIVLLRRMQVVSMKGRGFGVRVGDASAWAVFEKGDEEMLPQIKGPPVEVTDDEVVYAQGLGRWWAMQGEGALARVDRATLKASQAGKDDSK